MEQRLLRLGDIVDDYCPRERRVTNHAIVAIVENTIRQTRCSTCDSEHEYKEGKVPKKRTKSGADATDLAGGVLVTPKTSTNGVPADSQAAPAPEAPAPMAAASNGSGPAPESTVEPTPEPAAEIDGQERDDAPQSQEPTWFTHRPLIRASLPKTDGEPPPQRAIPEFTMHQRQGRGFGGRDRGGYRQGFYGNGHQSFRGNGSAHGSGNNGNSNGNEPDGNRAPQPGRPGGGPGGGGGGRRRRRRRR